MKGKIIIEIDEEDLDKIFKVEDLLLEMGIEFDTGMYIGDSESGKYIREWHLDGVGQKGIRLEEMEGIQKMEGES